VKILVADDDPLIRRIATISLSRAGGHQVTCAPDGVRAVECAIADAPDAILLDLQLPASADGLAALERLKGDDRTRHVPVVMLSASVSGSDRDRALALGATGWIAKPFDPGTLAAQLAAMLGAP
jgi:CheY-like chemotaxis protein